MAIMASRLRRTVALARVFSTTSSTFSTRCSAPALVEKMLPSGHFNQPPVLPFRFLGARFFSDLYFGSNSTNSFTTVVNGKTRSTLFERTDYNHWLVTMEFPDPQPTKEEKIPVFEKALANVVGSLKGAESDINGNDLGTTNLCVAVMEGKVPARVPNVNPWVEANGQQFLACQTGALALGKMKGTAESSLGRRVVNGVITLPSYFNYIQRQAVNDAGRIAGFSSLGGTFEGTSTNGGASVQNIVNAYRNINRPLSPHLSIYEPQLTSTYSIFNRISGAFLTAVVLSGILVGLEIGPLSLTYPSLYQSSFYANLGNFPKLTLSLVNFTLLAFCYHLGNGLRHICWDMGFFLESPRIIRISEFLMLCIAFSAFAKIIQKIYF